MFFWLNTNQLGEDVMNARQFVLVGCATGLALFASTATVAAQGRGGFGMFGGAPSFSRLLGIPEVQAELKLEGDALEKVKAFVEEQRTKMQEEMQAVRDQGLSQSEMQEEMTAIMEEFRSKQSDAVATLLSADQLKRAKELLIQQQGPAAVLQKDVGDAIGLADADREKLKTTVDEMNQTATTKAREMFQDQDREGGMKVITDNRKKVEETVMAALSDDQKKKFAELKGAEFKFPEPQPGGQRRRDF